ncbi:cell division protein ZapA [Streptococcus sp. DD13]|uniref:cell division protein ZapA n=1 Tax=Streptococcus sp. DD13 TaxID=1777881 RepID=UPI00079B358A|nr:cell division protein ZapA [Streptococcus sp. DD13]KXT77969.1 hypothetical protein STRDD13_01126 [Streptococcus sp. DD13]
MTNLNRYKFTFGEKQLTLTTEHNNLFMEEIERLIQEKYQAIKEKLPHADAETLALLLAINSMSVQLKREEAYEKMEKNLEVMRGMVKKKNVTLVDLDNLDSLEDDE